MKTSLTAIEIQTLISHIESVLKTGKAWEEDEMHHPAGAIIDAVLTIKGMKKDESNEESNRGFQTNGWQYDWWQQFVYKGNNYTLSGSGYYGGHGFNLSDE